MKLTQVFFCLILLVYSSGFLLDGRTTSPQTTRQTMSDQQFYTLMNLLSKEGNARLKLEEEISQLKEELLATQQGVTTNYHASHSGNASLKTELDILKNNYSKLQNDYSWVMSKLTEIELNNTHMNSHARTLEHELISVKQLKSVAKLETVLNISSETKQLKNELQLTNNQLRSIANDVNARKQDFIALFDKADTTDKTLDLALKKIVTNISSLRWDLENTCNQFYPQLNSRMQVEHNFTRKLEKEIQVRDGRKYAFFASLSANRANVTTGRVLIFGTVTLNVGGAYSAANGKFTCKEDGLYFFSWSTLSYSNKDFTSNLVVNGHDVVQVVVDNDKTSDLLAGSNSAVVQLRQGESVWIKVIGAYIARTWGSVPVSVFTGFLIH